MTRVWTLIEEGSVLRISPNATANFPSTEHIGSTVLQFRAPRQGSHRGEKMVYRPFTEEDRSKARLIAAAPELLDALKLARELLDRNDIRRPEIDAAIAKAEGR